MVKEKRATIEEILATFSAHVSKSYPSPDEFQERLRLLLENKRERTDGAEYADSLEANIVFLHDLIAGGRALLDLILKEKESKGKKINSILGEMEKKVRSQVKKRRAAAFSKDGDEEFRELAGMKRYGGPGYIEKLEFNYLYLMTLRILLFEFFNVLESIKEGYKLAKMSEDAPKAVTDSLGVTAHYYLGNVKVEEEPDEGSGESGAGVPGEPGGPPGGNAEEPPKGKGT
jgi:hypothetical protein